MMIWRISSCSVLICSHMESSEDSPSSSEGSIILPHSVVENLECSLHQDNGTELNLMQIGEMIAAKKKATKSQFSKARNSNTILG